MCKCICKGANSVFFIHTFAKRSNGVFRAKWALNCRHPSPIACAELSHHSTTAVPLSHSAPQHHRTPIAWSVSQWPLPPTLQCSGTAWCWWYLMLMYGIAWHLMLLYGTAWHLILRGIRCYCMVLPFPYHCGDPSQLPESPVRPAWVRQSAILFIRISHGPPVRHGKYTSTQI